VPKAVVVGMAVKWKKVPPRARYELLGCEAFSLVLLGEWF